MGIKLNLFKMSQDIWLLYALNQGGWGVFHPGTCPDPYMFPEFLYRHYEVPREKYDEIFSKLLKIQEKLVREKIIPTKENQEEIFPKLEELLED